jgi:uncharacterized protein YjbI with pentapeptide repeats
MANPDHIAQLMKGVASWDPWREKNPDLKPNLSGANLSRADLSGANLSRANLSGANLIETNLSRTNLGATDFSRADLSGADLIEANLIWAILSEADLGRADLTRADLSGADFSGTNLAEANLQGANLRGANLEEADLRKADLNGADLREANLRRANLSAANLAHASAMAANLREADLKEANLFNADLGGVELNGATLTRATLVLANLAAANLSGANLCSAYLCRAFLGNASLIEAKLRDADLQGATLLYTDLTGADLTGCRIHGVSAWDVKTDEGTKQTGLIITRHDQPAVMVDDLQVAQFIYLLLDREKLRNVIDAVTRKGVLLLGRFGDGGLALLQALAAWLRRPENGGYLPLLFDFPRPESKTYTDTIRTLASLARFVIVDLSGPSVPQEITATVDLYEIPFVPVLDKKRKDWSMFKDFLVKERVLKPVVRFTDQDHLLELLAEKVITRAEKLIAKRQKRLDTIFGRAPKKSSPLPKRR